MKKVKDGYKKYEFGIIPNDWQVKKIGDIFSDLKGGATPSRLVDKYYTGDIPWITSGELKYKTIYSTIETITEEAVKDTNLKLYPEGTFFIAITGLEAEGTRGSCAITGVPATTNQSCLAFQPKKGFSNLYLYYWYRLYGNYIGLKYTQGTKQQSLNNKIVGKLEIPVPKLEEQEKIAAILSTVDEQIDNVDALIEKNKELKKGLMQTLLTKGIGHTKFKKTEIGEIPEEWEVKSLENFNISNSYGPRFSADLYDDSGNCKVIRGTDVIQNGKVHYEGIPYANIDNQTLETHRLIKNDFVVVTTADCGMSFVFNDGGIYMPSAYMVRIRFNNNINPYFVNKFFETKIIRRQVEQHIRKGTIANLPGSDLLKFKIYVPSLLEQEKIVSILSEVDKKIEEYENKKQKLEELKKGLMQKLLTGNIRVN